ncbi:hypothetical protein sos41_42000 [Alphaproteobacteria bacterium SO-S41]|nr:hypothetical protein sos41_42000 [Alphaproteobacteria bacterium SO-S41]
MSDSRPTRLWKSVRRLAGFWGSRSGNIAMMFGIAAIPFFAFGGLAVDFSRAMMVKNRLAAALDATALAVGGQTGLTEAQLTASANAFFRANYATGEIGRPSALRLTFNDREVRVAADATVDTVIMGLIGFDEMSVTAEARVVRSSNSLEIAMVLDVTGSMSGSRITDLRAAAADLVNIVVWDDQAQFTSKVALIPFSVGVNVSATYAAAVRGAVPASRAITGVAWWAVGSTAKTITAATKANPAVITSTAHGFATGDVVWIASVGGMTTLNAKPYTITKIDANKFSLNGVNSSSYSTYSSGGTVRKCLVAGCEAVITSNSHGFANGDKVFITSTVGTTQINSAANTTWTVANASTNSYSLSGSLGPNFTTYSSGGQAFCTTAGCQYYAFTNAEGNARVQQISTCVTERIGVHKYDDVAPATAFVGRNYPASSNPCLGNTIVPLTSDKALLTTRINALAATGSTAGQIGAAWGWYMISPNFASLWPVASQPRPYGTEELIKIAVFMTDGDFNTSYCNGVISADAGTGSGAAADHINCNATNGNALAQAAAQCTAMKAAGVIVYTVGFDIADTPALVTQLRNCATDTAHAYLADNGAALRAAFRAIAVDISSLRLSH